MDEQKIPQGPGISTDNASPRRFSTASVLSIILNLILIVGLLLLPGRVIPPVQEALRSTADSLLTLSSTFSRISLTLNASTITLEAALAALEQTSQSIDRSSGVIDTASDILGDLGEGLIINAQNALNRMESAAVGIDRTIDLLALLGLLGSEADQEQESLSESIQELNRVLEGWPEDFEDLSSSLDQISGDIAGVTASLDEIQGDFEGFLTDIEELTRELEDLSRNFKDTAQMLDRWGDRVPILGWSFSGLLVLILLVNTWLQISRAILRTN